MVQGFLNKFRNYSFKRFVTYCVLEVFVLQTTLSCVAFAQIPTSEFLEQDVGITVTPLLKRTKAPSDDKFMIPGDEETVASAYQVNISRKEEAVSVTCQFTTSGAAIYSDPEIIRESPDQSLLGLLGFTASDKGLSISVPGKHARTSFLSFVLDRDGHTEFTEVRHAAALYFETTGAVYFPKDRKSYSVGSLNLLADQMRNGGTIRLKDKGTSSIRVRDFLNEKGATLEAEAAFYGQTTTLEIIADLYANHGWIESQVLVERTKNYRNTGTVLTEKFHGLHVEDVGINDGNLDARDLTIEGGNFHQNGKIETKKQLKTDVKFLENTGDIEGVWIDAQATKLRQKGDIKGHQITLKGTSELSIAKDSRLGSKRSVELESKHIEIEGLVEAGTDLVIEGSRMGKLHISKEAQLKAKGLKGTNLGWTQIAGRGDRLNLFIEKSIDLDAKSIFMYSDAKLATLRVKLKAKYSLTNRGQIIGTKGVDLTFGHLEHNAWGVIASGDSNKISLRGKKADLQGRFVRAEKTDDGFVLHERDPVNILSVSIDEDFTYDPERFHAGLCLFLFFNRMMPDLRAGIRTNSSLYLWSRSVSGTLNLEQPIFAKGRIDLKAPGVDVVYVGGEASFESDRDIKIKAKSLDLKGRALSKGGSFTTEIEEALKVGSNIEAAKVHLKSGSLSFHRAETGEAASGAGASEPTGAMPLVLATSDLGADEASLVLNADAMDLTNARLQTPGAISITNKETGGFRPPERFKANGYHIDTQGHIVIERPLRVEGPYGLRLFTSKTIRIGRWGHLAEVHTLRGPLELAAHLLDLRWAQLFSEQDMTLTSKTDILVGESKKRTIHDRTPHHRDKAAVKWTYHDPNGAYLHTNSDLFMKSKSVLNDTGRIRAIGDWYVDFKEGDASKSLTNRAGHIRIGGSAYLNVEGFTNTVYKSQRVEVPPKNYIYQDIFEELETSGFSHLRIEGDLKATIFPTFFNRSSIVNVIGKVIVGDTVVSPSGFFRNETMTLERESRHHKHSQGGKSRSPTITIADVIVGRDATIPAGGAINTGRFRVGELATFQGSHDFYSENVDPQGRQGGIRLTWPELDSVLYKRNPDPRGPVMIPRAPIRLRYDLPLNPQMVFVHPGAYFSSERPVRPYLSPEAFDHVLAMQVGSDIEVSKLSPPEMLARLENNTRTFMEKRHLALPMSAPQPLLMDAEVKETRIVPMNPMTTMSMINPSHVDNPMILWGIQMMDGYPTLMPAFIRRIDTTPTGHTSARRLQLFYGNKVHLVGATVQGREALKMEAPTITMEAAYYTTTRQIDDDTHEERHIPVRASAIAGEGEELGDIDVKTKNMQLAGARVRGRGKIHADRLTAVGAKETTTVTRVKKESGPFGGKSVDVDSRQEHVRDSFEGELNEEGGDFADLTGVHFEGRHQVSYPQVALRASQNRRHHMHQSFERGFVVNTSNIRTSDSTTYGPAVTTDGSVRFTADGIMVEDSRMRPMNMNSIDLAAGNIVRRWMKDHHSYHSDTRHTVGAGLQVAIAIGAGMATGGVAAGFSSAALGTAVQGLSAAALTQFTTGMINNGLDLGATLRGMERRESLNSLLIQTLTAGTGPSPTTLAGHVSQGVMRAIMTTGITMTVTGRKFKDVFPEALTSSVVSGVGAWGAGKIGRLYGDGAISYWRHKALHAGLGAATGALLSSDDPWVGAASGATGGILGEIAMEAAIGSPEEIRKAYETGKPLKIYDVRRSNNTLKQRAEWVQGVTRMGIAMATAYAGGNPYIADTTADNAIRNNSIPSLAFQTARALTAATASAIGGAVVSQALKEEERSWQRAAPTFGEVWGALSPAYLPKDVSLISVLNNQPWLRLLNLFGPRLPMTAGPEQGRTIPGFTAAPDYLREPTVEAFPITRWDLRQSVLWTPAPGQSHVGDGILYTPTPDQVYDVLGGLGTAARPQILYTPIPEQPNMSILMKEGGKDKASGSEIKYPNNPDDYKEEYKNIVKTRAQENINDGAIWEKDFSSHGGPQWKRWSDRKSWEKGDKPDSIWPDGRVRKKGDT